MKTKIPWELVIAQLKKESTPEQEDLFEHWLKEDDHTELYSDIAILWNQIQESVSKAEPDLVSSWEKMRTRIHPSQPKKKSAGHIRRIIFSAAASILLLLIIGYGFRINQINNTYQCYSALNGKSKIILPDSSIIWLNTGSTLRYASSFSQDRRLQLEGEASFEVTKDKRHPFTVSCGEMKVKVYGTIFTINSFPNKNDDKVSLRNGSVSITLTDGVESFLKPGEMATIDKKNQTIQIERSDVELESCWAKESVTFRNRSLGDICKYLEKWYNVRIKVDPRIAESQFYTFTIKDDTLEALLRTMAKINPIAYTFDNNDQISIQSR